MQKDPLTRILAIAGTVLVWFPILAPVVLSAILYAKRGVFRFDYLMPAEFFPVALAGGLLLFLAAVRASFGRKLLGLALGLAVASLVGGQALAVLTGLASGETEPVGWPWALVLASLVVYVLAVVVCAVGGLLLLRVLFRRPQPPASSL